MYDDGTIDDCINRQKQAWRFVQTLSIKMYDKMMQAWSVVLVKETVEPSDEYYIGEIWGIYEDGTTMIMWECNRETEAVKHCQMKPVIDEVSLFHTHINKYHLFLKT